MMDVKKIGANIKKMRESVNLTQTHIANFLEVDQSFVSKIEKGERAVSTDTLEKLAILFCCPTSALLYDEEVATYNFAFRTTALSKNDLSILSVINKLALNQLQMDKIAGGVADD